jgi:hypothetical protein
MVSCYLLERFDLTMEDVRVSRHDPKEFVARFRRRVDRDRVLAAPASGGDEDDGSPDSNINKYHPRIDDGPPRRSPTDFGGLSEDDGGSGDSNSNRYHPGMDRCADSTPPGAGSVVFHGVCG